LEANSTTKLLKTKTKDALFYININALEFPDGNCPKDWIDKRLRGIAIRQNLTDEWQERGISSERDFRILTAEIAKATFGMSPSEHKQFKGLSR